MKPSLFLLLPLILIGTALLLGQGCGSISSQGNDGGGGQGGTGQAGSGATGLGGTTGNAGAGGQSGAGGQGGGVACGPVTCSAGTFCCNAACGICAPPGAECVQGCPMGGQGGGAAGTSGQAGASGRGGSGTGGSGTGGNGSGGSSTGGSSAGGASGRGGSSAGGASGKGGTGQGGSAAGASGHGGGSAGTTGQGGAGGGATCAELVSDYAAAMTPARACTPGATGQCQVLVSDNLSYCVGCSTYVNDATKLNAIRTQWTNQGCAVPGPCPLIACILPGPVSCVATDSGPPGGTCTIAPATTN